MLVLATVTYCCAYQKPDDHSYRKNINYRLTNLFPKLNHIKVSRVSYEKYHKLYALINKYGNNFKTLPGMPLANYLTNTNSPIIIDWVFNAETGTYNTEIIKTLQNKNSVVLFEKNSDMFLLPICRIMAIHL